MLKETEIKALVSLLDDEDAQIVSHVEDKILSLGTPIIPFLEQEWESNYAGLKDTLNMLEIASRDRIQSELGGLTEQVTLKTQQVSTSPPLTASRLLPSVRRDWPRRSSS